jgi:hypothetical protein
VDKKLGNIFYTNIAPIPVAARSKAWVSVRSLAGIVGSNPAGDMDVYFLGVLCVVQVEVYATSRSLVQRNVIKCYQVQK